MRTAKIFDVHDKNISPAIYTLLFSDAYVEITGNDNWYQIFPFGDAEGFQDEWQNFESENWSSEELFRDRIKRGYKNCYFDEEKMKQFIENPCTCAEAVEEFKAWLTEQGVTKEDELFVKIWW